jgi:hypothetical protein
MFYRFSHLTLTEDLCTTNVGDYSVMGGDVPKWLRGRFAKPFCAGSSPVVTSKNFFWAPHLKVSGLFFYNCLGLKRFNPTQSFSFFVHAAAQKSRKIRENQGVCLNPV